MFFLNLLILGTGWVFQNSYCLAIASSVVLTDPWARFKSSIAFLRS